MRDIIISCLEGGSASSKDEEATLSSELKPLIAEVTSDDLFYTYKEFNSAKLSCTNNCVDFNLVSILRDSDTRLLIVAKSLGVVKAMRILRKLFNKHDKIMRAILKVSIIFIDGHSSFPTFYGPYRDIKIPEKWYNVMYLNIDSFYQRNHYPRGAFVRNAATCIKITDNDVNHSNIIHCEEIRNRIRTQLLWLAE